MRFSKEIAEKIIEHRSQGLYTIEEICKKVGIGKRTYHNWRNKNGTFGASLKSAEEEANQCRKEITICSFVKLLQGYDYEETHTEIVPSKTDPTDRTKAVVRVRKIIKKHVPPSAATVIFAMKNYFSETFKDRFEIDTPLTFEQAYEIKYGKPSKTNGVKS